jgi:hypothetical protein
MFREYRDYMPRMKKMQAAAQAMRSPGKTEKSRSRMAPALLLSQSAV